MLRNGRSIEAASLKCRFWRVTFAKPTVSTISAATAEGAEVAPCAGEGGPDDNRAPAAARLGDGQAFDTAAALQQALPDPTLSGNVL